MSSPRFEPGSKGQYILEHKTSGKFRQGSKYKKEGTKNYSDLFNVRNRKIRKTIRIINKSTYKCIVNTEIIKQIKSNVIKDRATP